MAMEKRQQEIREGAGLEESRLNTEFIDLLKKYSTPALLILAVVVGGYALYTRWEQRQAAAMDTAASELDAALESQNPANLVGVANDHSSRGALPLLARLGAADVHLDAGRTGIPVGTRLDATGNLPADAKLLTDDERKSELAKAKEQYQLVLDGANSTTGQRLAAINALFGLSAVAESTGDFEAARSNYAKAIDYAKSANVPELANVAQNRIDTLDKLKSSAPLLSNAQLHTSIKPPEAPITLPMTNIQAKDASGNPIQLPPGVMPIQVNPDGTATQSAPPIPIPAPTPDQPKP